MSGNLIFIGMMGVGKSSVARECAYLLGQPFVDADEVFEKQYGRIEEAFSLLGEDAFRRLETQIIEKLAILDGTVISCGGGAVLSPAFPLLADSGKVILLTAQIQTIIMRLQSSKIPRPLFGSPDSIRQILEKRQLLYQKFADFTIKTDDKSISEIANACTILSRE